MKASRRGVTHFELFSDSPMWWMCKDGNPAGAANGNDGNIALEHYREFAVYLATIAKYARDHWGISFTSVEPFNEPTTAYWFAGGRQEGCHFSPAAQAGVLPLLREELTGGG